MNSCPNQWQEGCRNREGTQPLKIATWNVNGIRARYGQLAEWVAAERPDIICLQEIKATLDQVPVMLCGVDGYWCYWHGGKGYSGVGPARRQVVLSGAAGLRTSAHSITKTAS